MAPSTRVKILQVNLNRSRAAWELALHTISEDEVDVMVVSEPNVAKAKEGADVTLVRQARGRCLLCGDFNAKSSSRTRIREDARGRQLADALSAWGLHALNEGSTPTFARGESTSHIDITAASDSILERGIKWEISVEENLSDHRNITVTLNTEGLAGAGEEVDRKRWKAPEEAKPHFIEEVRRKDAEAGGEQGTSKVKETIAGACRAALRVVRASKGKRAKYWWTREIEELRRASTGARRRLERRASRATPEERQELVAACSLHRNRLRAAIAKSREGCRRRLLQEVEEDVWGQGYRIVRRKMGARHHAMTAAELSRTAAQFFPTAEEPTWDMYRRGPYAVDRVTEEEVKAAADRLAPRKAPGPDGIPAEAIKWAVEAIPRRLADLLTRLLEEGKFPDSWKQGLLVLIPKASGGVERKFRPLCLLDTLPKLFEQVLLARVRTELEERGALSDRQHGFRAGRSTLTALKTLAGIVEAVKRGPYRRRKVCAMVTLDIKNAFNSASWRVVLQELERRRLPEYLVGTIADYLRGRLITVGTNAIKMSCGVPQGSILGPTLWNIMYDPVLRLELPEGVTSIAYADDLALVGVGKDKVELEERLDTALATVQQWMEGAELQLAAHKTEAVVLVGSRRTGGLRVTIGDQVVETQAAIKYLGVWVGKEYRFGPHVTRTLAKVEETVKNLARLMPNVGGAREGARRLLAGVATAQILYAAPVWADALRHAKYRAAILSVQRRMALRVAACYRTTSGAAARVVASLIPWHLMVHERVALEDPEVSQEEARRRTLERWQQEWADEERAGWTRRLIPNIARWVGRQRGQVTHWMSQALTGHGAFGAYLHRFKIRQTPVCLDCGAMIDDVEHTLFICPRWEAVRATARLEIAGDLTPEGLVGAMLEGPAQWRAIEELVTTVIRTKDRDDRNRVELVQEG